MRPISQIVQRVAPIAGAATILVLIGAVLRIRGLAAGDPFVYPADEWLLAKPAMTMVATGDWNPHMFFYPSALIDIEALLVAWIHGTSAISLEVEHAWLYESEFLPAQFAYVVAGRAVVAAMGIATVPVVFESTRRLVGLPGAIAAGLTIAIAPLAVENAHYLTTDVPAAFLCALSLLATIAASRSTRWWPWALAGLTAGLAGSMKWNGLAVVGVPLLAWALIAVEAAPGARRRHLRIPLIVLVSAAVGLIAPTPGLVRRRPRWPDGSAGRSSRMVARTRGRLSRASSSMSAPCGDLRPDAHRGCARAGRGDATRLGDADQSDSAIIPAFTIGYLVIASIPVRHFDRNLLPILPFIAFAIGIGVDALWRALRSARWPPRLARIGPAGIVVLVVVLGAVPPATSTVQIVQGFQHPTRVTLPGRGCSSTCPSARRSPARPTRPSSHRTSTACAAPTSCPSARSRSTGASACAT